MDILDSIAIHLPCLACGQEYEVPLRDILLSHRMLHEGCPISVETECPPLAQSKLVGVGLLEDLQRDWGRLEASARAAGGHLVMHRESMSGCKKDLP